MKKLRLEMDALRVETFSTADARVNRGTVEGYFDTVEYTNCGTDANASRCVDSLCCGVITPDTNCDN